MGRGRSPIAARVDLFRDQSATPPGTSATVIRAAARVLANIPRRRPECCSSAQADSTNCSCSHRSPASSQRNNHHERACRLQRGRRVLVPQSKRGSRSSSIGRRVFEEPWWYFKNHQQCTLGAVICITSGLSQEKLGTHCRS